MCILNIVTRLLSHSQSPTRAVKQGWRCMQRLKEMDINIIEDSGDGKDFSGIKAEDVVILPAFGASVQEMKMLSEKGVQLVDTTCPWVAKVSRTLCVDAPPRTRLA